MACEFNVLTHVTVYLNTLKTTIQGNKLTILNIYVCKEWTSFYKN
jgi:hypothetical protein